MATPLTAQEAPAPKRSDTDPMIKRFRAVAEHPKVPKLAGKVALGLANHRTRVSDWSERTIGTTSPLKARLDAAQERAQTRQVKMEQKLADQNERMREKFGPVSAEPPTMPQDMPEQVTLLPPQEDKK